MNSTTRAMAARGGLLLVLAAAGLALSGAVHAEGTAANTTISNQATLQYSVGSTAQPQIRSAPGAGSTDGTGAATTFVVDNKINHTVATTNATAITGVPGQTNVVTSFTVTNSGNLAQGYVLSVANVAAGQTVLGSADTIDLTAASCVINVNGTGATSINTLNPDASTPVTVSCTIPTAAVDADHIAIALVARATDAGTTTPVAETAGAGTLGGVDVVFADGAGLDTTIDAARDGRASARSAYHIETATIRVTKTVATVCDPLNGSTTPKNIPGAYVRYTITVANTGSASAILSQITDALQGTVQFDKDLIVGNTAANCDPGTTTTQGGVNNGFALTYTQRSFTPKYMTTGANADGATHSDPANPGGTITINFAEALPADAGAGFAAGELKAGQSLSVTYQVRIR